MALGCLFTKVMSMGIPNFLRCYRVLSIRWIMPLNSQVKCELLASLLCEALAAKYGLVALRLKRNSCYAAAYCAGSLEELSCTSACVLLCISASLASLRLVFEALFCEEFLLTSGEYEVCAAILALQCLVCVHSLYPLKNICPIGLAPKISTTRCCGALLLS